MLGVPRRRATRLTARLVISAIAALAVVGGGTVATHAATRSSAVPRATPPCNSSWNVVANPAPESAGWIASMTALSSSDVWAVGSDESNVGPTFGPSQTLAEHWDGNNWNVKATPEVGNGELTGVSAVPGNPNDIYAVGDQWASSSPRLTLIEHWDGTNWSVAPSPNPTNDWNQLNAVVAISASDVWAVGYSYGAAGNQTLTEHFDGVSWTVIPSPNVAGAINRLGGIAATGPSDVWALAGAYFEHWDGTIWSVRTSPIGAVGSILAISPTSVWAVGSVFDRTSSHERPLFEHWDGSAWQIVASPIGDPGKDTELFSISGVSDDNIWATGFSQLSVPTLTPLLEHWNGSSWALVSAPIVPSTVIVASSPTNLWTAGGSSTSGLGVVMENLCISKPAVSGVTPLTGNSSGGTQISVIGSGFTFASDVKFGSVSATSFTINSDSQISAVSPLGSVGSVDVTVTNLAGSSTTTPADIFAYVPAAVSWKQYTLVGSDGATWKDIDATNLNLTLSPSVNSNAIVSGNADLWTATPGVNQDIGVFISGGEYGAGQLYAWKESGGFAGTFSPNAAFVQTIVPLTGGITYTVKLQWKANHSTSGAIFVGAGSGPSYSPTRLSAEMLPSTDPTLQSAVTAKQYTLTGSNGSTWQDVDSGGSLTLSFTPASSGSMLLGGNADLWTQTAGVNQDIGVFVAGGSFGGGQVVSWKESGGFAGTFSPNAAYVQSVVAVSAGTAYTIRLQWKANHGTTGRISAGAGLGPQYSQTRVTMRFFSAGTGLADASTNVQYATGYNIWYSIDWDGLSLRLTPAVDSNWILTANADLWTDFAGVNQDIGILVSGGEFGSGELVAWKESGGFAGTFSPNAAFVQTVLRLKAGMTYRVMLMWKTNRTDSGMFAGAGVGPQYSPTRVTAQLLAGS